MDCSTPSFHVLHLLLELAQSHVLSVGDVIPSPILCCTFRLHPPIIPSIRVFSNGSALCIRWPKYWSFSFSNSLSNEYSGLISFRIHSLISLLSKGLSRVLQHHSLKASILYHSSFFMVQLSHLYMATGKILALTIQTFHGKVFMPFNILSRLVIAFILSSKCLLISWLQSPSAVILEPKKTKSLTVPIVSPPICHEVMGLDVMIFIY